MHYKSYGGSLPMSSIGEDLETISKNKLSLLFNPSLFELRPENLRDKGVDLIIELKQDGAYTNFRFAIQLKSTKSVRKNSDRSISYPVEVSNINYLLNYPMPAYYIIYDHGTNQFYYEQAFIAYQSLLNKYKNEAFPKQFKIRFSKLLTAEVIGEIYDKSLANGHLLRRLNPHLEFSFSNPKSSRGIVIDENSEVFSIEENLAYIDHQGFNLLNDSAFNTIIEIEKRTHPRKTTSPIFNLVCGFAYFHQGKSYKALDFLRQAQRQQSVFDHQTRSILAYTTLQAKHDVGILDQEGLKTETLTLLDNEAMGSFLEVEKAWKELQNGTESDGIKIQTFYSVIRNILGRECEHPKSLIHAYAKVLEAESAILINDLTKNLNLSTGTVNADGQAKIYKAWKSIEEKYLVRLNRLMEFAGKLNDMQAMGNISRMKIEWHYKIFYISHFFDHWNFSTLKSESPLKETIKQTLLRHCEFLDKIADLFKMADHEENIILCLKLKYQLLHFLEDYKAAEQTAKVIKATIETNDLAALQYNFDNMLNKGTEHERFREDATSLLTHIYKIAKHEGIENFLLENPQVKKLKNRTISLKWTIKELLEFEFPDAVPSC
jgi:hypothetical protein